jgi:N-carbamoyl-L-amino-acid hydrolase
MKLIERIEELSKIGLTETGICRSAGSKEDSAGKNLVVSWMLEDGLEVRRDNYENIIGRMPGSGPPIVTGSHTDTVATAGKYDGVLGVLAGLEAARELKGKISSPLEVVIFHDEENTMSGSIGYCSKEPNIKAFLELHVEQGPVLDFQQLDIGVVEGIVGQRRCSVSVFGQENHAGTTPMNMRNDALVKTAEIITYINQKALECDGLVATVGVLDVFPNAFSVVPGQVDFTLQVRDLDSKVMEEFVEDICKEFDLRYEINHQSEPALCADKIQQFIEDSCSDLKSIRMPSRASHDAQNFTFCPMGMIFVPSIGGISHSPKEHTTDEMCYNGLNVLVSTILKIDKNL